MIVVYVSFTPRAERRGDLMIGDNRHLALEGQRRSDGGGEDAVEADHLRGAHVQRRALLRDRRERVVDAGPERRLVGVLVRPAIDRVDDAAAPRVEKSYE